MSGWRTLHGKVSEDGELPSEEEISEFISQRGGHTRTSLRGDSLYVLCMERESGHLKEFAEEYASEFDVIGIGSGTDTGPGNDRVTFYDIVNGSLEKARSSDCPIVYNGLRVESTR